MRKPELTGNQIETLRIGLQIGFRKPQMLEMFLRERLNKLYGHYVAQGHTFSAACYNIITSSEAEGWRDALILEAYKARRQNPNIAKVSRELGLIAEPDANPGWSPEDADAAKAEQPLWRGYNPYRGMLALREQDANYLFGRDRDVDRFIDAIETDQSKILLALGASGVGKSSLIFAGVLAALRRRARKSKKPWPVALEDSHKWPHLVLTPGTEPVRSLAGAFVSQWIDATTPAYRETTNEWRRLLVDGDSLSGLIEAANEARWRAQKDPPSRYLIYVDQGEELYARGARDPGRDGLAKETAQQKEARRFSELLAEAAAHTRLIVLMSARSNFLGQLQADGGVLDKHPKRIFDVHRQLNIGRLGEDDLKQIITRPAKMLGVAFENGLDKVLAAATREEIGGLPLLSYTLETLWQEMQVREGYAPILRWNAPAGDAIDIARKLADRADTFVNTHRGQEAVLQRLFCVRLAHVPAQGDPTRKRALLADLSPEERDHIAALAGPEQRIVVTGESEGKAIAEIAHEKLFTAWETLRRWIDDRRSFYAWATHLSAERCDWELHGEVEQMLLSGWPLERARLYLADYKGEILEADANFIRKSVKSDQNRKDEEEAKKLREERLERENAELRAKQLENDLSQTREEANFLRNKTKKQADHIFELEFFEKLLTLIIIIMMLILILQFALP